MTLILSGTNGLSDVDGDASTPAVRGTDANTGIFFPAADTIAFAEGGAEAMRIDSSGNLNIGTNSSFGGKISILKTPGTAFSDSSIAVTDGSNVTLYIGNTSTTASSIWTSDLLSFGTGADAFTERARITSGGDLLLGTTTNLYGATRLQSTSASATGSFTFQGTSGVAGYEVGQIWKTNTSGDNKFLAWITEGGAGTERGSVTYNRAGNLVSYNTSSDYRLKENIINLTDALETVARLQPRQFTWKETGNTTTGFIAHELAEVLPHAVTGEKDETETRMVQVSPAVEATHDEEGNELTPAVEAVYEEREVPKYQGVDTSFLVATLTAAIQELKAELDEAKARIAALETGV
jgi:hypothetical protein